MPQKRSIKRTGCPNPPPCREASDISVTGGRLAMLSGATPGPRLNEILQDLKFGLRTLLKSPGFVFVALSTIGVAIGANAAIFSFVDGLLLKSLPYDEPDRIVRVLEKPPGGGRNGISTLNYLDWASQNTVFEYIAGQAWGTVSLTGV